MSVKPSPLHAEGSSLRLPTIPLSRKQILILDGIRYASEMAHISYVRLSASLQSISGSVTEPGVHELAVALLDAWSIIDSANRFRDLLVSLPGLPREIWVQQLSKRTEPVAGLRDCVQHCNREVDALAHTGGQLWGYISWVHMDGARPSGRWFMLSGGTHFKNDSWLFIGPSKLPFHVPPDRMRLNAFGKQVYLWRIVASLAMASKKLESALSDGHVRLRGEPAANRLGADAVLEGAIEVIISDSAEHQNNDNSIS